MDVTTRAGAAYTSYRTRVRKGAAAGYPFDQLDNLMAKAVKARDVGHPSGDGWVDEVEMAKRRYRDGWGLKI